MYGLFSFIDFSMLAIQHFQFNSSYLDVELIHAGDQGFLNSYYSDFANSRVYEPDSPLTPEPETQRLSTLYNADVGLYMLANKVRLLMYNCILIRAQCIGQLS
jgi:hypothetical protein